MLIELYLLCPPAPAKLCAAGNGWPGQLCAAITTAAILKNTISTTDSHDGHELGVLGARLDETHHYGAFAMHGHTTDSGLIRPRRRQEPPARSHGPRRVGRRPDCPTFSCRTAKRPAVFTIDLTMSTPPPLPLSEPANRARSACKQLPSPAIGTALTSGLAISAFLLYLAVHSLLEMQRVRNNVDAGT